MKINDDELKAAIDVARQALAEETDNLNSAQKTAFLTIATSLVMDVHRIADSTERLAKAAEQFNFVKVGDVAIASTKPE